MYIVAMRLYTLVDLMPALRYWGVEAA